MSDTLGRRLPVGRWELDWLVVGATGDEQLGAVPTVLERFPPQQVLWAGAPAASRGVRDLGRELASRQIPVTTAQSGQAILLGRGAELRVLEVGRRWAVYLVEWGKFRALLPLGMDVEILYSLQADLELGPVSVLMLADSGYGDIEPAGVNRQAETAGDRAERGGRRPGGPALTGDIGISGRLARRTVLWRS